MKLSIQRFVSISFLLSPVAILSAEHVLLPEDILTNDTLVAFQCFVQARIDREFFEKKGMDDESMRISFDEDFGQLRAEEARQAVQRSALDEEIAATERRLQQAEATKKEAILRQRAALLATVDREMSVGWVSKPGNTSWR